MARDSQPAANPDVTIQGLVLEQAEAVRPPGNDEALLRWNRCVRSIQSRPELAWSAAGTR
jgi:hypothetical protein